MAALKAKSPDVGNEACCLFAVALNRKFEHAWCKHMQAGEPYRHGKKNKLTEEEQNSAGVVVGRLSATGVPERTNAGRDASGGGGDGGGKRKGSSFRRQAAGSAKRRV